MCKPAIVFSLVGIFAILEVSSKPLGVSRPHQLQEPPDLHTESEQRATAAIPGLTPEESRDIVDKVLDGQLQPVIEVLPADHIVKGVPMTDKQPVREFVDTSELSEVPVSYSELARSSGIPDALRIVTESVPVVGDRYLAENRIRSNFESPSFSDVPVAPVHIRPVGFINNDPLSKENLSFKTTRLGETVSEPSTMNEENQSFKNGAISEKSEKKLKQRKGSNESNGDSIIYFPTPQDQNLAQISSPKGKDTPKKTETESLDNFQNVDSDLLALSDFQDSHSESVLSSESRSLPNSEEENESEFLPNSEEIESNESEDAFWEKMMSLLDDDEKSHNDTQTDVLKLRTSEKDKTSEMIVPQINSLGQNYITPASDLHDVKPKKETSKVSYIIKEDLHNHPSDSFCTSENKEALSIEELFDGAPTALETERISPTTEITTPLFLLKDDSDSEFKDIFEYITTVDWLDSTTQQSDLDVITDREANLQFDQINEIGENSGEYTTPSYRDLVQQSGEQSGELQTSTSESNYFLDNTNGELPFSHDDINNFRREAENPSFREDLFSGNGELVSSDVGGTYDLRDELSADDTRFSEGSPEMFTTDEPLTAEDTPPVEFSIARTLPDFNSKPESSSNPTDLNSVEADMPASRDSGGHSVSKKDNPFNTLNYSSGYSHSEHVGLKKVQPVATNDATEFLQDIPTSAETASPRDIPKHAKNIQRANSKYLYDVSVSLQNDSRSPKSVEPKNRHDEDLGQDISGPILSDDFKSPQPLQDTLETSGNAELRQDIPEAPLHVPKYRPKNYIQSRDSAKPVQNDSEPRQGAKPPTNVPEPFEGVHEPPQDIREFSEAASKHPEETTELPKVTPALPKYTPKLPKNNPKHPKDTPVLPKDTPVLPKYTPELPNDTPELPKDTPELPEAVPISPKNVPEPPQKVPKLRAHVSEPHHGNVPEPSKNKPKSPEDIYEPPKSVPKPSQAVPGHPEDVSERSENIPRLPKDAPRPKDLHASTQNISETFQEVPKPPQGVAEPLQGISQFPTYTPENPDNVSKKSQDVLRLHQAVPELPQSDPDPSLFKTQHTGSLQYDESFKNVPKYPQEKLKSETEASKLQDEKSRIRRSNVEVPDGTGFDPHYTSLDPTTTSSQPSITTTANPVTLTSPTKPPQSPSATPVALVTTTHPVTLPSSTTHQPQQPKAAESTTTTPKPFQTSQPVNSTSEHPISNSVLSEQYFTTQQTTPSPSTTLEPLPTPLPELSTTTNVLTTVASTNTTTPKKKKKKVWKIPFYPNNIAITSSGEVRLEPKDNSGVIYTTPKNLLNNRIKIDDSVRDRLLKRFQNRRTSPGTIPDKDLLDRSRPKKSPFVGVLPTSKNENATSHTGIPHSSPQVSEDVLTYLTAENPSQLPTLLYNSPEEREEQRRKRLRSMVGLAGDVRSLFSDRARHAVRTIGKIVGGDSDKKEQ